MKLTIVGCSGSYAGPHSAASSYLVESTDADGRLWRVVLDMGNGALGPLQLYADPLELDAIFLSHLHSDHCMDVCGLYVVRKFHPAGPAPRIPVYGPEDSAARMARAYDLPPDVGMTGEFKFIEYDEVSAAGGFPVHVGPFACYAVEVAHPVPGYAIRLEADGRVLVYSGDTGPCDALVEIADGADLFLCEASNLEGGDNPPNLHLTGREAAEHATKAGAKRLVLTHIPPWYDAQQVLAEAAPHFQGETVLAEPGQTFTV